MFAFVMASSAIAWAGDDPLAPYRERFQQGLEKFRVGDVTAALQYWEPIHRELGDVVAYRLLFNLGKAHEALGDATTAAERYEVFLRQAALQDRSDDPALAEEINDAREHLDGLKRQRARITVLAQDRPSPVRIDTSEPRLGGYTSYVAPGMHSITVEVGTARERRIQVQAAAGQEFVFDPNRYVQPPTTSAPLPSASPAMPFAAPVSQSVRPFPASVLYVAAGVSVVSFVAPGLAFRNASGIANEHNASTDDNERARLKSEYTGARKTYFWSWAAPGICVLTTGALTLWYLKGSEHRVVVQAAATPSDGWLEVRGTF